jgi:hypothetical protein
MFIRFKRVRLAANQRQAPRYSIHCVLVESYRIQGKPRQRVLKYLGSIQERALLLSDSTRRDFINHIEHKIDELKFVPRMTAKLKVELIRKIVRYGRYHH